MRRTQQLLYQKATLKLEMLHTPIRQLGLTIEGSFFENAIPIVLGQLRRAGVTELQPYFYVSTGYGCIASTAIISLGFYDFDPLLKELNYELRGWYYSAADLKMLLRHELGHAFCYTYKLYRSSEFRQLFQVQGNFFNTYPQGDAFDYNPWSKRYVNPNGDHYAQKHPDEDFAETFCVWLTPRSSWRRKYAKRSVILQKLQYAQRMAKQLGPLPPRVQSNPDWMYERVEDLHETVGEFMKATPKALAGYQALATGFVDPELNALFRPKPRLVNEQRIQAEYTPAAVFLRQQKTILISRVADWVGVDATVVRDLLEKLIQRAEVLELWLENALREMKLVELSSYVTVLCANYKNTGKYLV